MATVRWGDAEKEFLLDFPCPACKEKYSFSNLDIDKKKNRYKYCPNCGKRLLPPMALMGVFSGDPETTRYS
jgi:NAD-dependent SIR2 family protein deacetylase